MTGRKIMANLTPTDGVAAQATECAHTVTMERRVLKDMPVVAVSRFCCNCGAQLGGVMIKNVKKKERT